MAISLVDLFAFLDDCREPPSVQDLLTRLDHLGGDLSQLTPFRRFSPKTYSRNLVHGTPLYNVLVLCWRSGQRSPIHDHRGSRCAVRVLEGVMTETLFEFAPNGLVKAVRSRDVGASGVVASEDMDIHQVSNLQADGQDLVTLHVYTPPLLFMGTYDLHSKARGEEPMFLEFQDAAGI